MPPLTIAVGNYGLTKPLKDGSLRLQDLRLQYVQVDPITSAMRRMVRGLEFDICEMAFATYLCAKALGKPITAVPVFLTRNFQHRSIVCNTNSGIEKPKDMEGRTVAVNRGYTVTTGLWARGILQSEYDVDLKSITWVPTDDEHVSEYKAPVNVDYSHRGQQIGDLLNSGIGAAVGDIRVDSPNVRPLIADAQNAGFAYFRKTGVYPINHTLVVKDSVLKANPELGLRIFNAFQSAKALYTAHLDARENLSPADETAVAVKQVVGDVFPFGVSANRKALETIVNYGVDQGIIPTKLEMEQLFDAGTLGLD
jgi:4,5-dihydroxyphthalate decarboxylase